MASFLAIGHGGNCHSGATRILSSRRSLVQHGKMEKQPGGLRVEKKPWCHEILGGFNESLTMLEMI